MQRWQHANKRMPSEVLVLWVHTVAGGNSTCKSQHLPYVLYPCIRVKLIPKGQNSIFSSVPEILTMREKKTHFCSFFSLALSSPLSLSPLCAWIKRISELFLCCCVYICFILTRRNFIRTIYSLCVCVKKVNLIIAWNKKRVFFISHFCFSFVRLVSVKH